MNTCWYPLLYCVKICCIWKECVILHIVGIVVKSVKEISVMARPNETDQFDDRRIARRKRRKKNQMIAYVVIFIFIALLIVGGYLGVRYTRSLLGKMQEEKKIEETQTVTTQEPETETLSEEETTTEVVEYTQEDLLNEVVDSCISEMSLEDKVAGLFIVTPEGLTGTDLAVKAGDGTKEALEKYPVGGIIYFKQNIKSEEQITEMLANTVSMSKYPIFLGIDEEGGSVACVQEALKLEATEDMQKIGESADPNNAYQAYQKIGSYLCGYGFNLDFAPVADILTNEDNKTIETRSFGKDASMVAGMISSSVTALTEAGVTPCIKHFPGQGGADGDPHSGLSVSTRTLDQLKAEEFVPFQAGIDAGAQMVMVGHISLPEVIGDNTPSSLSKMVITDILRGELGYNGVIITDALNMSAITEYYTSDEACIKALKAGSDMLLMPEDFKTAYEGVVQAVKDGTISEERIDDSLARVYRIKYAGTIDK